jgi:hypothetical protein
MTGSLVIGTFSARYVLFKSLGGNGHTANLTADRTGSPTPRAVSRKPSGGTPTRLRGHHVNRAGYLAMLAITAF